MRTIYKYEVLPGEFTHHIPRGAKFLTTMVQGYTGDPQMWFEVDDSEPRVPTQFMVVGTGHQIPNVPTAYRGSYQIDNGRLIFHVYELVVD